jgi:hypothetical protein
MHKGAKRINRGTFKDCISLNEITITGSYGCFNGISVTITIELEKS